MHVLLFIKQKNSVFLKRRWACVGGEKPLPPLTYLIVLSVTRQVKKSLKRVYFWKKKLVGGLIYLSCSPGCLYVCIYSFINVYFWDGVNMRGDSSRERGGQRIWSGVCADSREPDMGLELSNAEIMTWPKPRVRCLTDWATQLPWYLFILNELKSPTSLTWETNIF